VQTPRDSAFTTQALLRRARKGDRLAFEELFERHLPRLHRWARGRLSPRLHGDMDTTDVVQDAAVRVFQRLGTFEPTHQGALQAYLRRAVINRIRDAHRRVNREPDRVSLASEITESVQSLPLDQLASAEVLTAYKRALARLPGPDQEAVVARLELGYSYDQIAVMLGRPSADAARMAVTRAIVRIATEMEVVRP